MKWGSFPIYWAELVHKYVLKNEQISHFRLTRQYYLIVTLKKYTYYSRIVLNLQNYCEDITESSYRFYSQFSRILISYISMLCLSQFITSPNPDTCIHAAADPAGPLCRPITWMTMKIKLTLNTYLLSTSYGPGIELAFCINHRI